MAELSSYRNRIELTGTDGTFSILDGTGCVAHRFSTFFGKRPVCPRSKRALAGDPGHWMRIDNEEFALQRCKDSCPDKDPKPEPVPVNFEVPKTWWERYRTPVLVVGGVAIVAGAIALAPVTGGGSLAALAAFP